MNRRDKRAGFTMVEVIVSSTIAVLVIGGVMAAFIEGLKVWQQEDIRNELNMDLESAMERIRADLRLSSVGIGLMSFYPSDAAEYTAISMPLSPDANPKDGYLDRNEAGKIQWNDTVIYHVRPGTPDQLMRTVFSPRLSNATPEQLYQQLATVVAATNMAGISAGALAGESCQSICVFENLVNLRFRPPSAEYDCYGDTPFKPETYNFGSVVLDSGNHELAFSVTRKNVASSGYRVPIDKFSMSPSTSERDGELFSPINTHPASPYYQCTPSNGTVSVSYEGSSYIGYCALNFNAASGSVIKFTVYNDLWCDNNFDTPGPVVTSNCTTKVSTNYPPVDVVVSMDKGTAWTASSVGPRTSPGEYTVPTTVTNFVYGGTNSSHSTITMNGRWARFRFERGTNCSLMVTNAQVMNWSRTVVSNITFNNGKKAALLSVDGDSVTNSDWVPMWTIDKSSNYVVRFETLPAFGDQDLDLFVGTSTKDIKYFRNDGNVSSPSFAAGVPNWQGITDPLVAPGIAFVDVDGNSAYDLFVGGSVVSGTGVKFYKNVGTSKTPSMQLQGTVAGIFCSCGYSRPVFTDMNGDGLYDCVYGHSSGYINMSINVGTPLEPSFSAVWFADRAGNSMKIGVAGNLDYSTAGYAAPELADIDGDGDKDLFTGSVGATICYWENIGTAAAYSFTNAPDLSFGGITNTSGGYLVPRFADIDGNGTLDLLVGDVSGRVNLYLNTGTVTSPAFGAPTMVTQVANGYAVPALCNIDGEHNGAARWQPSVVSGVALSTVNGTPQENIVGLESVEVGYPDTAIYRSGIFDTRKTTPVYSKLNWTADELQTLGGKVDVRVRTGAQWNLSDVDETAWTAWFTDNLDNSLASLPQKRYLQYEARLTCGYNNVNAAHTNKETAVLRDLTIDWPAAKGLVDLQVDFGKGPDCGVVMATVDGQPFWKSAQAEMEIYKAGRLGTNYATGILELKPLNTGR